MALKIEKVKIDTIRAYEGNAKRHPQRQIDGIKKSIQEFGFNDPISIDENGVVIEGHGRLEAMRQLGETEVPVIRLEHLTPEQKRAYVHVHNQLTMETDFDRDILAKEIAKIQHGLPKLDMAAFGFSLPEIMAPKQDWADQRQRRKENILNLGIRQFSGVGPYDIPQLDAAETIPDIDEWVGIDQVYAAPGAGHKGVHFFKDDYKFECVWTDPLKWVEKLRPFCAVMSPDFSPYGDMPLATQIYNHYRKHWVARLWQDQGLTVIPTIRASTDPRSLEWFTDGEPVGGVVAYSSMWVREDRPEIYDASKAEWDLMIERLRPMTVIVYGHIYPYMDGVQTVQLQKFAEKWWEEKDGEGQQRRTRGK